MKQYMVTIGYREDGAKDGPWFCEFDSPYVHGKLLPWLRERGCTSFFAADVRMPEEAYTRLGASPEMPR